MFLFVEEKLCKLVGLPTTEALRHRNRLHILQWQSGCTWHDSTWLDMTSADLRIHWWPKPCGAEVFGPRDKKPAMICPSFRHPFPPFLACSTRQKVFPNTNKYELWPHSSRAWTSSCQDNRQQVLHNFTTRWVVTATGATHQHNPRHKVAEGILCGLGQRCSPSVARWYIMFSWLCYNEL